jgi:hypothetical protein
MLVKVIHDSYKRIEKVNKKTGEKYPAYQPDGAPCGIVVALKSPRGGVKVGWSKCNLKLDKFNKIEGVKYALKNLHPLDEVVQNYESKENELRVPHALEPQVLRMAKRADKYYSKERRM